MPNNVVLSALLIFLGFVCLVIGYLRLKTGRSYRNYPFYRVYNRVEKDKEPKLFYFHVFINFAISIIMIIGGIALWLFPDLL
jgi:uncharacterized Tic20 family protein